MDLKNIVGGASLNAAFLNALARSIGLVFDVAKSLGSSLRRLVNGNFC